MVSYCQLQSEHTKKLWKILNLREADHDIVGDPRFPEARVLSYPFIGFSIVSRRNSPLARRSASDIEKGGLGSLLSKKGLSLLCSKKTITEDRRDDAKENTAVNAPNPDDHILQQF